MSGWTRLLPVLPLSLPAVGGGDGGGWAAGRGDDQTSRQTNRERGAARRAQWSDGECMRAYRASTPCPLCPVCLCVLLCVCGARFCVAAGWSALPGRTVRHTCREPLEATARLHRGKRPFFGPSGTAAGGVGQATSSRQTAMGCCRPVQVVLSRSDSFCPTVHSVRQFLVSRLPLFKFGSCAPSVHPDPKPFCRFSNAVIQITHSIRVHRTCLSCCA